MNLYMAGEVMPVGT